ncbi:MULTISPECIES: MFS transporter [Aerococcus]|uniref:MFS transporter n=1 Tax=Aerococcus sanguinicola TaxID=119206 RepID=A0A5N1GH41_9LACT|nr:MULTISPECIES: MFS transporter [Aerococcus]KAA9300297.1 MFS transporter [Aerococcus sanguinicola]MDK6370139.1 MFS transporter [Aerococcus sp. UMB9870]MDK6687565.1 MFS transporter [Aerococcus sp. UMB8623]OFK19075.1 MFS transporter [Aerococcus sp. HMSC072A12]OFR35370.1 MFS transporter [Aerococcus sp. HMSC061A03]
MHQQRSGFSWPLFILMASITFMAILSELMPSGVLPQMAEAFGITEAQAGGFVGQYAIASAVCGIPIISATVEWDRKKLLMLLLIGFGLANLVIGLLPIYWLAVLARILGGVCAGALWPMISAYGMSLVKPKDQGKAVAVIMAGTTVGMSLGLPLMTWIGTRFSFRLEFIVMAIFIALVAFLCQTFLPHVPGEKRSRSNSPLTMLKNKGVLLVVLLTVLAVVANYGVYTYITNLVKTIDYPGIGLAQILFGIGSILSVLLAGIFIDHYLRWVCAGMLGSAALAMACFYFLANTGVHHLAFILWGIGFGALVTLFQTAVTRQVSEGTAVATSLQSAAFNFSIMIGSTVGGWLLASSSSAAIVIMALLLLLIALGISLASKTYLA